MGGATIRTIENDPDSPFGPRELPAAEWTYRHCFAEGCKRGFEFLQAWLVKAGVSQFPAGGQRIPEAMSLEHSVDAYVNHGRWVWDCPRCGAAQVASTDDPRAFCCECLNGGDGWYPVMFPADRPAVEWLLGQRPEAFRNWYPGETVEKLQGENLAHGLRNDLAAFPWPGSAEGTALARAWLDEQAALERERREELVDRRRALL
ncbi:MAG TPA: hypothetical protein VMH39_03660 [Gemmatimonadaceae bacterium]|nr:hypothetical protein [Gemmatimonadaceae bacterium]